MRECPLAGVVQKEAVDIIETMMWSVKSLFWIGILSLLLFRLVSADDDQEGSDGLATIIVAVLLAALPEEFGGGMSRQSARKVNLKHRERSRKYVNNIFKELGPYYVRRAYRMKEPCFWNLHRILKPFFYVGEGRQFKKGAKNGLIPSPIRLSAALRYFAGGRPEDICLVHGISHTEVFRSVWFVVDAVNRCTDDTLQISYPESHEKQYALAAGFKRRSRAGFDCCAGCIDGMLVWLERPNPAACEYAGCGAKKFMCGRKKKFGLNMQGTCDSDGKFIDVQLWHPASTSDFLSFTTSSLYRKLEQEDFLAPGLCLFGDAAYVNNRYFATPFKSVSSGPRDDYNFYHSQVRIKIECTFGMFVKRWGILRRALPASLGLRKTTALVICLCRLHNYCIERTLLLKGGKPRITEAVTAPDPLASDALEIVGNGGVALHKTRGEEETADELMEVGHHNDDTNLEYRRQFARRGGDNVPRNRLLVMIEEGGFHRPMPKNWERVEK